MTFEELGLSEKVLKAVADAGYVEPTEIQKQAIPPALAGKDVLGLAQTGSGKTAAFVLPMLMRLERGRARARMPRTLILEPTRELAAQVFEAFQTLGKEHRLKVALLIGGVSFDEQSRIIDRGADVIIATPGRLLDHFERGKLLLTGVEVLVIDEADRMLDMGFIPDIERIVKLLPVTRQTLFFSATMPSEIEQLTARFLHLPVTVQAQPPSSTAETIDQKLVLAPADERGKRARLREVIDARREEIRNAIIFANRKKTVEILAKSLQRHRYNAGALHGDMDQYERLETLQKFRDGEITFLVASDVAARGLDIPEVSHVFNFDVPVSSEDYVHRIGRTGRAGREGTAVTLVTPDDFRAVVAIEKLIGKDIPWEGEAPSEEEVAAAARGRKRRRPKKKGEKGTGRREERAAGGRRGDRGADASGEAATGAESEGRPKKRRRRRRRRKAAAENGSGATPASSATGAEAAGGDAGRARRAGFSEETLPAFLARPVEREG
ncbi:MAG TPA: DEAD/DEAH box helicase [Thermopetrobacter sp.]|nr:DEAD/DEAH box helicase [Thermopetrobacter sp.]